jgi:hypothetical protein
MNHRLTDHEREHPACHVGFVFIDMLEPEQGFHLRTGCGEQPNGDTIASISPEYCRDFADILYQAAELAEDQAGRQNRP